MNTDENGQHGLPPATCSASWYEEHSFWFTKFDRAVTRYKVARENGDQEKMGIAAMQMDLYKRRMDAVVIPEEVKESCRKRDEAERLAALNDE